MKLAQRSLSVVLLLATFPVASQVQPSPDSHLRGDSSGAPDHESAALMGKVVMEDGSDTYPVDAIVVMLCGNDERASANVDRKGQFALVLGRAESALAAPASRGSAANAGDWGDCALRAEASGYRSEPLSLAGEQL